jgi:hypothetical protein
MTPDFVVLMTVANDKHSIARSALPDAPVIADFVDRSPREPRLTGLRIRLAELIWPGELITPTIEQPAPAASC